MPTVRQGTQACSQRKKVHPSWTVLQWQILIKKVSCKSNHKNPNEASLSLSEFEITYWFHDQSFPRKQSNKLSITKKSSLSSKTPSKCIFSMIFILSTSCIMHYHICITSLACFAIMLSTTHHGMTIVRIII